MLIMNYEQPGSPAEGRYDSSKTQFIDQQVNLTTFCQNYFSSQEVVGTKETSKVREGNKHSIFRETSQGAYSIARLVPASDSTIISVEYV